MKIKDEDIYEKNLSKEEILEIIKKRLNEDNSFSKLSLARMYNMAKDEYQRRKKEDEIIEKLNEDEKKKVKKVYLMGENGAIIETFGSMFSEKKKSLGIAYTIRAIFRI